MTNTAVMSGVARTGKKARKVLVFYAVGWTIGIAVLFHLWGSMASADSHVRTYVVNSGDTLWSIAQHDMSATDTRAAVDQLMQVNHLKSASLNPGQKIRIPMS